MTKTKTAILCTVLMAAAASASCASLDRDRRLVKEPGCADFSFQVYFAEQSARVHRSARGVIADAAKQLKGCPPVSVEILGLADSQGAPGPNLTLSRQRGEAVAAALAKSGFPSPSFRVAAAGESGAITPEGDKEPLRRRAEVFVRFTR